MRAQIVHAAKLVIRYLGPVASAVHGELSKPEIARAAMKAVITGGATWGTMKVSITDPDTITSLVIPVTAAAFTGVMDAMSRLEQGKPKPIPPPDLPPVPPTAPPPSQP